MQLTEEKERLISRYLNGVCTEEERQKLHHWLRDSENNEKLFFQLKDVWDATHQKERHDEKELLRFYRHQSEKRAVLKKSLFAWRLVAGLAVLVSLGVISWLILNNQEIPEARMVTCSVPMGSRSTIWLADGTEVVLNSGSQLEYPSDFGRNLREVRLSGEGYFRVHSDKKNPFVVKTDDFDITVTGTTFNVCTYRDDPFSTTSLLEGEITISASNIPPVQLKAGEKIRLDRTKKQIHYVTLDSQAEVAWKQGEFLFKNIAFPELVKRLERWYNVSISFNSIQLESLIYSGSFKNQETIWQVLDALKLTSPIDYTRKDFREFTLIYKPE